jgi:hypothetical protein
VALDPLIRNDRCLYDLVTGVLADLQLAFEKRPYHYNDGDVAYMAVLSTVAHKRRLLLQHLTIDSDDARALIAVARTWRLLSLRHGFLTRLALSRPDSALSGLPTRTADWLLLANSTILDDFMRRLLIYLPQHYVLLGDSLIRGHVPDVRGRNPDQSHPERSEPLVATHRAVVDSLAVLQHGCALWGWNLDNLTCEAELPIVHDRFSSKYPDHKWHSLSVQRLLGRVDQLKSYFKDGLALEASWPLLTDQLVRATILLTHHEIHGMLSDNPQQGISLACVQALNACHTILAYKLAQAARELGAAIRVFAPIPVPLGTRLFLDSSAGTKQRLAFIIPVQMALKSLAGPHLHPIVVPNSIMLLFDSTLDPATVASKTRELLGQPPGTLTLDSLHSLLSASLSRAV